MPRRPHIERHFGASDLLRDIVIGMADGLTVPFALAAGLSGAVAASGLIVTAGVAEIAAGAIAMGLGGYLAARGDAEHYAKERKRELHEVRELPREEEKEIVSILSRYGLTREQCAPILAAFHKDHEAWVDFMMRYELGLERPVPGRALRSACTIGGAYVVGGLVPLVPYMLMPQPRAALWISAFATLAALALFGAIKGRYTGSGSWRGAWQTVVVGGIAACAAYFLARLVASV
ncbi:MAG TPA: VIT1/CCC1 transporter family protein [Rhodanobacteraceae bacterium]|nr:VIT1/CCC1 transporter family protein [Rhodanobacteraceae bacterium]